MDFTISLAHFCELHGPTSVLCTQVLPAECSACLPSPPATPSLQIEDPEPTSPSYFSKDRRPGSAGHGGFGLGDGDRCASCRMTLPDEAELGLDETVKKIPKGSKERHPLRTREDVHVCASPEPDSDEEDKHFNSSPASIRTTDSAHGCHSHRLQYVSSSSPPDSESFSNLRRATIRTLSGEQLPRGQTSGPLWFGDPVAGYTIAYVFRLADLHARGRQRYYALLALVGSDTQRAFNACTMIWTLFEQIARHIVRNAEEVAAQTSLGDSPPDRNQITPVSSFLTSRTMEPDGYPRRGIASMRANGIAELVDNENFFCELHMMFVGMLQELGRVLGGMKVKHVEEQAEHIRQKVDSQETAVNTSDEEQYEEPKMSAENKLPSTPGSANVRYPAEICSPGLVAHRHPVAV